MPGHLKNGFSLVEMLIALAVSSIIIAAAFGSYTIIAQNFEFQKDIQGLQDLRLVFTESTPYILSESANQYIHWPNYMEETTNIEALGQVLYTYYFCFFFLASLILLVAMIGAIVLTMHKGVYVKRQEIYVQNTREFTQTIHKLRKKIR